MDSLTRKLLESAKNRGVASKSLATEQGSLGPAGFETFHHKAASYSVWALVASFGVNIVLSGIASSLKLAPQLRPIIAAILAFLFLSAMLAAIIALSGIPRYGRRKLLWKGLVGLLVPIALIALAVPAFLKVKQASEERARQTQSGR